MTCFVILRICFPVFILKSSWLQKQSKPDGVHEFVCSEEVFGIAGFVSSLNNWKNVMKVIRLMFSKNFNLCIKPFNFFTRV